MKTAPVNTAFFRFYEELNDYLPENKRKVRFCHSFTGRASVKDLAESIGVPHNDIDLILVSGVSVNFSYIVNNGDDISVYPVFESFDISPLCRLRPAPLRRPGFVLDVHLGKLAKYMRMLGLDTLYETNYSDDDLAIIAMEEKRAIITRDRGILKRNDVLHAYWIRSQVFTEQLVEVIARFDLKKEIRVFSRCLVCNSILGYADKNDYRDLIPERAFSLFEKFYVCHTCRKIYWEGSHYTNMLSFIDKIIGKSSE